MFRFPPLFALLAVITFVSASCGGNDSIDSNGASSQTLLVGPEGGNLKIERASLNIDAGSIIAKSDVVLAESNDSAIAKRFVEAAWLLDKNSTFASAEYHIRIDRDAVGVDTRMTIRILVPANVLGEKHSTVKLLYLNNFSSDDSESGEDIETFAELPSTFDSSTSTLTATIRPPVFGDAEGQTIEALLKVLVDVAPIATTTIAARVIAIATASSAVGLATGWHGCSFPSEAADADLHLLSPWGPPVAGPQLNVRIIAPFDEPKHGPTARVPLGHRHHGIDLRASIGTTVHAVRAGYIELVKLSGGAGQYVVVRHPDGTASRYLHLKPSSVLDKSGQIASVDRSGTAVDQSNWQETDCTHPSFVVIAGQALAQTGDSGSPGRPHLHFEYGRGVDPRTLIGAINPITRLGTLVIQSRDGTVSPQLAFLQPNSVQTVRTALIDSSGQEMVVRRRLRPEAFLPVTAKGYGFDGPPTAGNQYSNWPLVEVSWSINDASIDGIVTAGSLFFPAYTDPQLAINTDGGFVSLSIAQSRPAPGDFSVTAQATPIVGAYERAAGSATNDPIAVNWFGTAPALPVLSASLAIHVNGTTETSAGDVWYARYSMKSCAERAPDGSSWLWQPPCNMAGVFDSQSGGLFFFRNGQPGVVWEITTIEEMLLRTLTPVAWNSSAPSFTITTPARLTMINVPIDSNSYGNITELAVRTITFTVVNRSGEALSGTFLATTRSGYFAGDDRTLSRWRTVETTSSGVWQGGHVTPDEAARARFTVPIMNGYDYCLYPGRGARTSAFNSPGYDEIGPSGSCSFYGG